MGLLHDYQRNNSHVNNKIIKDHLLFFITTMEYKHRENIFMIAILLKRTGLSHKKLTQMIFGNYTSPRWRLIMFHPEKLTVRQIHMVYSLLGGKYSIPLLCALAAGFRYDRPLPSWYEGELPPLPPELDAQERAEISVKELKGLRDKIKDLGK